MTEGNPTAPAQPSAGDEMTTILGGDEINITYLTADQFDDPDALFYDGEVLGSPQTNKPAGRLAKFRALLGTSERVKVRQVPLVAMRYYANALLNADETTAIEIYCGKEQGWAELLDRPSINAVADKGLEINLDFFGAWYRRQAKMKEKTTPQAIVELQEKLATMEKTITEFRSQSSSSPTSATTG
jgi:hypothetical protein